MHPFYKSLAAFLLSRGFGAWDPGRLEAEFKDWAAGQASVLDFVEEPDLRALGLVTKDDPQRPGLPPRPGPPVPPAGAK